jgi:hypothetical protein
MRRQLGSLLLALGLAAAPFAAAADTLDVGTTRIVPKIEAPSANELALYDAPGTGRVAGRFNLLIHGAPGQLEYRGFKVYLLPAVTWSYVWAHWLALSGNMEGEPTVDFDPWTKRYLREATTDSHGAFVFTDVPPGKYVLGSLIVSDVSSTHTEYSDNPTVETNNDDDTTHYDADGNGVDSEGRTTSLMPSWHMEHHYTANTQVSLCTVRAALEAVVTVAPTGTTNAPIAIAGSDYSGNCHH